MNSEPKRLDLLSLPFGTLQKTEHKEPSEKPGMLARVVVQLVQGRR